MHFQNYFITGVQKLGLGVFNPFAATSPIGDLDTLSFILFKVPLFRYSVVPKIFLISIVQILDISERLLKIKVEKLRF